MKDAQKSRSVSETVWPWRSEELPQEDASGKIRVAALAHGMLGALIGTGLYFGLSNTVGYVAWSLSGLLALIGLLSPTGLYAKIRSGMEAFGRFVGLAMAWLLLVPVYYLFFTPFRVIFRGGKKDAMTRWLEPTSDSYWVTREKEPQKEAYERQF